MRQLLELNTDQAPTDYYLLFFVYLAVFLNATNISTEVQFFWRYQPKNTTDISLCVGSGGVTKCALALGFEKMQKGSLSSVYTDRANPIQPHVETMMALR